MALSRRNGQRFHGSIWPGFVDAMTGLLLVLMFVLTIFMVVQFVLRETISGQETKLDALSAEVAALARALGLEQGRNTTLTERVGELTTTLGDARARQERQNALIAALRQERDAQETALSAAQARIVSFEEQVAGLLSDRDTTRRQIADLETARDALMSEKDALQLSLAGLRSEIDAGTEAARLAAARREALEALVADLRREMAEGAEVQAALSGQVSDLQTRLSDEEAARLTDAAAAEALRRKLESAQTELTAMTLALEEQRRRAEETLTLLAAAEGASSDLNARLAAALLAQDDSAGQMAALQSQLDDARARMADLEAARPDTVQTLTAEKTDLLAQLDTIRAQARDSGEEADALRLRLSETEARLTDLQGEALAEKSALDAQLAGLQERLVRALAEVEARDADLAAARAALAASTVELGQLKTRLATVLATAEDTTLTNAQIRERLTAALAAKLAAEQEASQQLSAAEERAALLAQARAELDRQEGLTDAARREQELLNRQVAALRAQLSELQALLDDAQVREAAADVQLQSLGNELNAALARVAAEERRRREAEEEKNALLEQEKQDLEKYRSEFFGRLRDVLGTREGVRIEGDRFVFSSEVLFAPGQAALSDTGKGEIAKVADILRGVVDDIPEGIDWVIRVDGHTDDVPLSGTGAFADNWELSQARALSVVRYMIDALGLPPDRLSANGFGQYQPVNPARTPEARAQNRRIELKFTEK